ncbi:MAG: response regulator transcription factor [Mucilaginibacter sp.]|nr:response regulator transcription factor [Mucilaginibacter sp.]
MIIKCIAVDDEPLALDLVASYIEQTPFLQLVDKCQSAIKALRSMQDNPDVQLLFLDIRMADLSGMELAKIIDQGTSRRDRRIIFTTAYDQYALEGYKVGALDYLMKPFNFADFSRAAAKAFEYFSMFEETKQAAAPATAAQPVGKNYIYLKVEYQLVKVDTSHILYIEGLKDYVKVFLDNETKPILTLTSLKNLEEKLPSGKFRRLHRSYIVSLDKVKAVTKNSLQVADITVHITDQYKDAFAGFLSSWT